MIIDCHGHYTTAPKALEAWRNRQIAGIKDPAQAPKVADLQISDNELREIREALAVLKKQPPVPIASSAEAAKAATTVLQKFGDRLRTMGVYIGKHADVFLTEAVKKAGIEPASSSVAMIPQNYIKLEGQAANTMIRLMEALEDQDDVQNVHSNFDIDQKLLEEVAG